MGEKEEINMNTYFTIIYISTTLCSMLYVSKSAEDPNVIVIRRYHILEKAKYTDN